MNSVETCTGTTIRYEVPAVGEWDGSAALYFCDCGEIIVVTSELVESGVDGVLHEMGPGSGPSPRSKDHVTTHAR